MPLLRRFWSVKKQHQAECVGSQTFDSIPPASIRSNPERVPKPARFPCQFQAAKNSCIPYRAKVSFFINKCYLPIPKRSESSAECVRSRSQTRAERGQNETDFFRNVSDLLRVHSVRVSSALWIDSEAKKLFFCSGNSV
jgi:hypothetical protein